MVRRLIPSLAVGVALSLVALAAEAQTFYSPSQAELGSFVFDDYWPGNGAALTNTTNVGADGVQYTFDTGFSSPTPDPFSRSQWTMPFTQDLTGYNNVGVAFQVPTGGSVNGHELFAQVDLHYNGGASMVGSGWVSINETERTNVYLPLSAIPPSQLMSGLTSFDIELRSNDPFDADMGDRVNAFTAPAPPEYVDGYQISDFEGNDPAEWVAGFQPDHVHAIVAADASEYNNGVTKGTHALQVTRTWTGENFPETAMNTSFRWGSQMVVDANVGGGNPAGDYNDNGTVDAADYTRWRDNLNSTTANLPNDPTPDLVDQSDYTTWSNNFGQTGGGTDPTIQAKIDELVDALNDGADNGALIAIDVSFQNVDNFPDPLPSFLGYEMYINDGSGFYQPDTTLIGLTSGQGLGFPNIPAVGEFYQGVTLAVPLDIFRDQGTGDLLGATDLVKNSTFEIGIASNTAAGAENTFPFTVTFVIDNIRIQDLVPQGLGSGLAVPEPSALVLVLLSLTTLLGRRR